MHNGIDTKNNAQRINRYFVLFVVLWTLVNIWIIYNNIEAEKEKAYELVANDARTHFYKDRAFRLWASSHGGVYVPPTKDTPPNPYLADYPERDIVTQSGKKLTLLNPAYMLRDLMEKFDVHYGVKGHITSLNPLRPENAADQWERAALIDFAQGRKTEVKELSKINGETYLRLMRPLVTVDSCLACHAKQGYRVGEIRGGISVSVPVKSAFDVARYHNIEHSIIHGIIWFLGLIGAGIFTRHVKQRTLENDLIEYKREQDRQYMQKIIDVIPDSVTVVNPDYTVALANRTTREISGYHNPVGDKLKCYQVTHNLDVPCENVGLECHMKDIFRDKKTIRIEKMRKDKNDVDIPVEMIISPVLDENGNVVQIIESSRNISERKLAETEQLQLKEQLSQAQKMESIGRLAGGVAHDFNNLLTGITGNVQLAQMDMKEGDALWEAIEDIGDAADKASELTKQLLAFSRKQIIKPKVIDLNESIDKMHRMLKRIIGEDIDLKTITTSDIGNIKADPGQIEQIVVNLAVNARDAMPNGGQMVIETKQCHFDQKYVNSHSYVLLGDYVMLAISDNGHGMDTNTQKHIFDPFFTTKKTGEGTGLGLSTVYGIIKQHSGSIEVYSEIDRGTTFKVYFPVVNQKVDEIEKVTVFENLPKGNETILVVEDVKMVRNIAKKTLNRLGYSVVEAYDGRNALEVVKNLQNQIDMVLTDVIMPNMNGKELSDEILKLYPEMKILFTSGYTDNVISQHGVIGDGAQFISKPYSPNDLAYKVRDVLDRDSLLKTDKKRQKEAI